MGCPAPPRLAADRVALTAPLCRPAYRPRPSRTNNNERNENGTGYVRLNTDAGAEIGRGFDGNDAIELHYWRKHPNLHGWMESLYYEKGGTADNFNCVNLQLTLHRAIVSNEMDKMQPLQICTRDLVTFHHGQFQGAELFIFKDDWFTLPKNDLVNGLRIPARSLVRSVCCSTMSQMPCCRSSVFLLLNLAKAR